MPRTKKKEYITGTGRRKTAVARVFMEPGNGRMTINGKSPDLHLGKVPSYLELITKPLKQLKLEEKYNVKATVTGGGLAGQADAIRLGIARALVKVKEENKSSLKEAGLLTRDPREKERKKYGRKGARGKYQRSKR